MALFLAFAVLADVLGVSGLAQILIFIRMTGANGTFSCRRTAVCWVDRLELVGG